MSKVLVGMDRSKSFRVYLTITTAMVEEARKLHFTSPVATAGLGRVLTATGIMTSMMKEENHKVTVIFKGDGPAKQIIAVGNGKGQIKGYISNPNVDIPLRKDGKLDVGGSLGEGELTVIKDLGLKEPYSGSIALVSGEIAEDLTAYYYISEQQNTSVALGVKVDRDQHVMAAGGMLIQMLPNCEDGSIDELERIIKSMPPITKLVEKATKDKSPKSDEGLLVDLKNEVFGDIAEDFKVEVLEYKEFKLECDCSRERFKDALMTIGKDDLKEIAEEDGQAEINCHFCGSKYLYGKDEILGMIEKI